MARPTKETLRSGRTELNFGPRQRGAEGKLGVYAPLNVRTGPSGAEQLAASLGMAVSAATPILAENIKERARGAAALGRAAASDGVSPEEQARAAADSAYALGIRRGQAAQAQANFRTDAAAAVANLDKNAPVEEVAKVIDEQAKLHLGGFLNDPESVAWVTPDIEAVYSKLTFEWTQAQAAEARHEAVSGILTRYGQNLEDLGQADYMGDFRELSAIVGKSEAHKLLVQQTIDMAEKHGAPTILDQIPKQVTTDDGQTIAGPYGTYNDAINKGREKAESVQKMKQANELSLRRADLFKGWIDDIEAGRQIPWSELRPLVDEKNVITEEEAASWYAKGQAAHSAKVKEQLDIAQFVANPRSIHFLTKTDSNGNTVTYTEAEKQKLVLGAVETQPMEMQFTYAMELASQTGVAEPRFAAQMQTADLGDLKMANATLDLYREARTNGLGPIFVPSSERRAELDAALAAVDGGAASMAAYVENRKGRNEDVTRKLVSAAKPKLDELQAQPIEFDGTGWPDIDTDDITNRHSLLFQIREGAEQRVRYGIDPAIAWEASVQDVTDRHVPLKLPNGRSMAIPRPRGMDDESVKDALIWAYDQVLVPVSGAYGYDPKENGVVFAVLPDDQSRIVMITREGTLVGNKSYSIRDFAVGAGTGTLRRQEQMEAEKAARAAGDAARAKQGSNFIAPTAPQPRRQEFDPTRN